MCSNAIRDGVRAKVVVLQCVSCLLARESCCASTLFDRVCKSRDIRRDCLPPHPSILLGHKDIRATSPPPTTMHDNASRTTESPCTATVFTRATALPVRLSHLRCPLPEAYRCCTRRGGRCCHRHVLGCSHHAVAGRAVGWADLARCTLTWTSSSGHPAVARWSDWSRLGCSPSSWSGPCVVVGRTSRTG